MNQDTNKAQTYQHLSLMERESIALNLAIGKSKTTIAKELGRYTSTVTREIKRNSSPTYHCQYRAQIADQKAHDRCAKAQAKVRLAHPELREIVESTLEKGWSPEQIAGRLAIDNPTLKTNYESIYQYIYTDRPDLITCLRQGHKKRRKRGSAAHKHSSRIPNPTSIDQRPKEANDRQEFGHWEADTIVSRQSKPVVQASVERKSRLIQLTKLPAKESKFMAEALIDKLLLLPSFLRKSITYDNGTENVEHEKVNDALGSDSYFCHPYHSWEKGTVENSIGLVRQYLPKKTDFSNITEIQLKQIENILNNRPRKCLKYLTPHEIFYSVALIA